MRCSDVMDASPCAVSFILRLTAFNLVEHHMNTIKVVGIDIAGFDPIDPDTFSRLGL